MRQLSAPTSPRAAKRNLPAAAPASVTPAAPEEDEPEPQALAAVAVATRRAAATSGGVAIPSLAGLPARAAIRTLEAVDLGAEVVGTGRVVAQSPPAGRVVERGARVKLTLVPAG